MLKGTSISIIFIHLNEGKHWVSKIIDIKRAIDDRREDKINTKQKNSPMSLGTAIQDMRKYTPASC